MIVPLSNLFDWMAIRLAAARMPKADGRSANLEEARQFLAGQNFIPAQSEPAQVEFNDGDCFRFSTPRPGLFAENNVVHGRLYRCGERWQERPAVILLHGWNDLINHHLRFPLLARRCNRSGFNAVTWVLPYHFQRRPRQLGAWSNFLCPDLLRTAEAAAQSIAEIRALTGWLMKEGCPAVALWGISLGGWLAGLAVCRDPRWAAAVLTAPVVRMDRVIAELAFCQSIREALRGEHLDTELLNLTAAQPTIPPQNILLIEAMHDLFVPKETIEELHLAWNRPELWRLPIGHISVLDAQGLCGRVLNWLAPRLNAPAAKHTGSAPEKTASASPPPK
jgi:pimeloyl-ACP methyl ester carboxylesterase